MTTFNFKEACLLDVSGELSPASRRELLAHLREHPEAWTEYEEIRATFATLDYLPLVEPSAHERFTLPAAIKARIRQELQAQAHATHAQSRWNISRRILTGVAAAAAVLVISLSLIGPGNTTRATQAPAQIDATPYLTALGNKPLTQFELAVKDVENSIGVLQTDGTAFAIDPDSDMADLLNALASVPEDFDDRTLTEPLGSPGSL